MVTTEQLEDIKRRITDLKGFLSIDDKKNYVESEELKTQSADFWDDPKSAEKHLKNINKQKVWVLAFDELQSFFY
jgi:peptide chain release factor 2